MAKTKTKCTSCKYRATKGSLWLCDYYFITGQLRKCEPGNECIKYLKGHRIKAPQVDIII